MNSDQQIRKKLEHIENEIKNSYFKDLNKTDELRQLQKILEEILTKDTLEEYFNNDIAGTEYFSKKFTNEVLINILRQNVIYGEDGHEIALSILQLYLKLFLKYYKNHQTPTYYISFLDSIKDIFENGKSFYGNRDHVSSKEVLKQKNMTAEEYNVFCYFKQY